MFIVDFIFFLITALLSLLMWAIIINAILSWLVAFDVINLRNRGVASIARALDAVVSPVLAPLRAVIPDLGGIDITPILAILIIQGIQRFLIPAAYGSFVQLLG